MANIGNLAWVLSANPAPLQKGLDVAKGSLASFAQAAGKITANDLAKGIKSAGGAVANAFTTVITNPLGALSDTLKAIPWAGELLALPVGAVQSMLSIFDQGASRIKEIGAAAGRTGIDLQSMQVLMTAAGGSTEGMEKSLFKMNMHLGEAQMGASQAKMAFERLGLSADNLAQMSGLQRFETIAERIRALKDPTLQAKASFDVFGKSAKDIHAAITRGAEGIAKAKENMDKFGLGFSEADLGNIKQADMAKKQLGLLQTGLTNQVTIAIGATLAEFNSQIGSIGGSIKGFSGYVITAFEYIGYGIATLQVAWDGWKLAIAGVDYAFRAAMAGWGGVFMVVLDYIDEMVKKWAQAMAFMSKFNPAVKAAMWAGNISKDDLSRIAEEGIGGKAKGHVAAGVGDLMKQAEESKKRLDAASVGPDGDKWGRYTRVATFFDNVRNRLNQTAEATNTGANAWANYFKNLEAFKEIQKSYGGPVEQFGLTIQDLNDKWAKGAFMGRTDLYNAALVKAYGEMEKTALPPVKAPATILEGSKEAYSAVLAFQRESQQGSVQEQMKAILEQQKQVQQQQAVTSKEILEAMRALQRR